MNMGIKNGCLNSQRRAKIQPLIRYTAQHRCENDQSSEREFDKYEVISLL